MDLIISPSSSFEMVIGIEVHLALNTKSKLCCSCPTTYAAPPNSHCCPICAGLPGSLPFLNREAVHKTILAGLATNCSISSVSQMARKHYFYPDCPKGYQITQGEYPLCENGFITIFEKSTQEKKIPITRIHLEEDAGKLIHTEENTLIDFNRSGVPLIEIVSAPVISTIEEALAYIKTLRREMIYAGITHGKMNEGDIRFDVNLSVKKPEDSTLGEKCEIKNLNSFQSVADAIKAEYKRQCALLVQGKPVISTTLTFSQKSKKVFPLRKKEETVHYRYLPDMDFPLILLTKDYIHHLHQSLPPSPFTLQLKLIKDFSLTDYQSQQLLQEKNVVDYFFLAANYTPYYQGLANLIINEVLPLLENSSSSIPFLPKYFAQLVTFLEEEKITSTTGKKVLEALWKEDLSPSDYITYRNLWQINDLDYLEPLVKDLMIAHPQWVKEYRQGKTALIKSFMGKAMALTKGKGNPKVLLTLFEKHL